MAAEEGERLREFLRRATGGAHGWVTDLAKRSGLRRGTLYTLFEGKAEPTLDTLAELARATGTSRAAILAAMDGASPEPLEDRVAQLEAMVDELARRTPDGPGTPTAAAPPVPRAKAG